MAATIHEWPADLCRVAQVEFNLRPGNLFSRSLYSGEVTPYDTTEQRWVATFTPPPLNAARSHEFSARVAQLRGIKGLLRIGDPARQAPAYNGGVTEAEEQWSDSTEFSDGTGFSSGLLPPYLTTDAAARKGVNFILLRGLPASTARVLRWGDLFEIRPDGGPAEHGHLYLVTGECRTDASGKTGVTFEPPLRADVGVGDMVVLKEPKTLFALAKDDEGMLSMQVARIGSIGFSLIEVLHRR